MDATTGGTAAQGSPVGTGWDESGTVGPQAAAAAAGGPGAAPGEGAAVDADRVDADRVDADILNALGALIGHLLAQGEQVARHAAVPTIFIKALHMLEGPMAMKELGHRMKCDPSFVTNIADMLEKRGLATRESDPADRRVKRLVLTPPGEELKQRLEHEVQARMPWRRALDLDERACLLRLVRKMLPASEAGTESATLGTMHSGEVSTVTPASHPTAG